MVRAARIRSTLVPALVGIAWLIAIGGGFAVLHRYQSTPGSVEASPVCWPLEIPLALEPDRLTVVLAIHPRCSCTRATARALEQLQTTHPGRARLNVLVFKPINTDEKWTSTSTTKSLSRVPDTHCW